MKASNSIIQSEIINRKMTNFNKIDPSPFKNKGKEAGLVVMGQDNWQQFYQGKVDKNIGRIWDGDKQRNFRAS